MLTNTNRHTPEISKLAGWRVSSIWFIICCLVESFGFDGNI